MKIYKEIIMMLILAVVGIISTLVTLTYAANEEDKIKQEYTPKLKIEHVIQIAKDYAAQKGMELDKYFIKSIKYDTSKKEWAIFFEGDVPAPGFHFLIVIEDRTKKIRLSRGK